MKIRFLIYIQVVGFLYLGSALSYASDSTAIEAYMMLNKAKNLKKNNIKEFLWAGEVNGTVSEETRNWNRPLFEIWGVSDRYPGTQGMPVPLVKPYSITDPGFKGPNNESFGIEIEFGDETIAPREQQSKNVRFYTDFGQTGAADIGMTRAEMHIRTTLQKLDIEEGSTLWIGWSEYYSHLDKSKISTVFQFRNQPNETTLAEKGFNKDEIALIVDDQLTVGGPAIGIITTPINGQLHYQFTARDGEPMDWTVPTNNTHISSKSIETGKWYDFVVQIKYSQESDGRFRIWFFEHDTLNDDNLNTVNSLPEWDFNGPTMYRYPNDFAFPVPSPEIRTGIYRHERMKNNEIISEEDRYMIKYLGPLRLWRGLADDGFNKVKSK